MKTMTYSVIITIATDQGVMLPNVASIENALVEALATRDVRRKALVTAAFATVATAGDVTNSPQHTAARAFYRAAVPEDFKPQVLSAMLDRLWERAADMMYKESIRNAYHMNEGSDPD